MDGKLADALIGVVDVELVKHVDLNHVCIRGGGKHTDHIFDQNWLREPKIGFVKQCWKDDLVVWGGDPHRRDVRGDPVESFVCLVKNDCHVSPYRFVLTVNRSDTVDDAIPTDKQKVQKFLGSTIVATSALAANVDIPRIIVSFENKAKYSPLPRTAASIGFLGNMYKARPVNSVSIATDNGKPTAIPRVFPMSAADCDVIA